MINYNNLVISGTNISIVFYIGALYILEQRDILKKFKNYYSTSFSGILILLLILGYKVKEILEIYKKIVCNKMLDLENYDIINLINNYGLYDETYVNNMVRKFITDKNMDENITLKELYEKTGKSLNIVVLNLSKMEEELINYKTEPNLEVYKLIRIGITLPFIFSPVKYNNNIYISGTPKNNFPICYCDIDETIGITYNNVLCINVNNIIELIVLMIYCVINRNKDDIDGMKNVIKFDNIDDLNFDITEEEIIMNYNYGKEVMDNYIKNNIEDNRLND